MDGDIFGAVSRLGRDAAEGLARAVHGGAWDPFLAARCIDVVVAGADGIGSLPAVIEVLGSLQATPLLASTLVERSLERIADAVRDAKGTVLDLMLRSVAERSVLRGEHEPRAILQRFCAEVLDRAIISGRGGFLELDLGGRARREAAMTVLACKTFADLVAIDPNVRFAARLPFDTATAPAEAESQVLTMYRRYASEVVMFFERARPTLTPRPHPLRKENERDLFAATG